MTTHRDSTELPHSDPPRPDNGNSLVSLVSGTRDHLDICSLVLSSASIPHFFYPGQGELLVKRKDRQRAQKEVDAYFSENHNWPLLEYRPPRSRHTDNPPTLLLMGSLAIFFFITGPWQHNSIWFQTGAVDSHAIMHENEWWRLMTALTLHADDVHLVGNCIIGGFLIHLLCKTIGFGSGLASVLLSGFSGNLINILLRTTAHYSVGFSTAVFGAIGIFCGFQAINRPFSTKELFLPLGAGMALLALLGTEGVRTDLGAHLFGLLCGLPTGSLIRIFKVDSMARRSRLQFLLFTLSLVLVIVCWNLALNRVSPS